MSWVRVFQTEDPELGWETNEFVVERDPETGQIRYGSDGGCSCYMGFYEGNFSYTYDAYYVRRAFAEWTKTLSQQANPARLWEEYMAAARAIAGKE